MNYKEKYQLWLDNLQEGDPLREELIEIKDNVMEIKERFFLDLAFGTAG